MILRGLAIGLMAFLYGCAAPPPAPELPAGTSAVVSDTATGGGRNGGAFFFLAEADGKKVARNNLEASLSASRGRGADLQIVPFERRVLTGKLKLKLAGKFEFAMPIQSLLMTASSYSVLGEVEVDLRPEVRYRITGQLDAFRREVWIEEEGTGQVIGQKIVSLAVAEAGPKSMADAAFTCCNLHYEGDWISDANWAALPFIPIGSRIVLKDYGRYRASVVIEGRPMRIGLDYGREQQTREQFVEKIIVKEDPNLRIAAFGMDVQSAIRAGKIMPGMTQEQVIMALGFPRTDLTRSLDKGEWTYFVQDGEEYAIVWGPDQRVKAVEGAPRIKRLVLHSE